MNRRRFLGLAGTAVTGLAGCINRDEETPTDTPTDTTPAGTPTRTPREGQAGLDTFVETEFGNLRIDQFDAQQSVVLIAMVNKEVVNNPEQQYMLFRVDMSNASTTDVDAIQDALRSRTILTVNGQSIDPFQRRYEATTYNSDTEEATLVFPVPRPLTIQNAVLTYNGTENTVRWDVPDMVATAGFETYLESPPELQLGNVGVPTTASDGVATITYEMREVSNNDWSGEEPFSVQLGSTALSSSPVYTTNLTNGETVERTIDVELFRDSGTETIELDWGVERLTYDIQHK